MRTWKRILATPCLLGVMFLLAGTTAEAKYAASQVTIESPILHNPLVLDERTDINRFIEAFFAVSGEDRTAAPRPGHLLLLTVYTVDENDRQVPVDRVVVSLDSGERNAQLYRLGMVNGWATGDGSWYQVAPEAVTLLLNALRDGGVDFSPQGEIIGLPSLPPASTDSGLLGLQWSFIGAGLVALAFLAGGWFAAGRRRHGREWQTAGERAS